MDGARRQVGGGGGRGGRRGGLEAGCGAVISSVQMRTCLRLRDAALSQAKDSIRVVKGIMAALCPASAFGGSWDVHLVVLFVGHFSSM